MKLFNCIDKMQTSEIVEVQNRLLAETVMHAAYKSPYYSALYNSIGVLPSSISSIDQLKMLPLTNRSDLQNDNWAFLAIERNRIEEIVATTGTTGTPAFIALTASDLERLWSNEERSFRAAGTERGDLFHLAVTCDNLFIAGVAYYGGLKKVGANVARIGPQNIIRHLELAQRLRPSGMVAVPSFVVHMSRRMEEEGITADELGLKRLMLIGDSIRGADFQSNTLGRLIEAAFGNICFATYGITEGQLSFFECSERKGMHSHPDFVIAEIVDDAGNVLPDGELGELVLTTLQVEAMPLIRYRTGDITFLISEPCNCGRKSVRIGPIVGRKSHRMKLKGVTLYPKTIENALLDIKGVVNYQIEAYKGPDHIDEVVLRIGTKSEGNSLKGQLHDILLAKARVLPRIEIYRPEEIESRLFAGGSRKAITFKDNRRNMYEQD